MARHRGKQTRKNAAAVQEQEPARAVIGTISPIGVKEDGRMYFASSTGQIVTASRLPYTGMRSVLNSLSSPDSDVEAFIREESADPDEIRARMSSELPAAGAKCLRALSRMKEKGLYAPTVGALRNLILNRLPINLGWPLDVLLDMAMGMDGMHPWDADIPDDIWIAAIELVMYQNHREAYMDLGRPEQWGVFVGRDFETIWLFVYLLTYGRSCFADMGTMRAEFEKTYARASLIRELDSQLRAAMSSTEAQRQDYEKRLAARSGELSELHTANARLERENLKLRNKLEIMEAAAAESEPATDGFEMDSELEADAMETFRYPLPETNILFVGGHPRLQTKLKAMHPKWKFVTVRMSYSLLDDNLNSKFVFFYTGHLSHKLFDKVRDSLGDVPAAYVSSQNMTRLHDEMGRAYDAYCAAQDSGA